MTDRVDAKAVLEAMRNSAFCPEPWAYAMAHLLADLEVCLIHGQTLLAALNESTCENDTLRERLEAAEKALREVERHHVELNAKAGRPESHSHTLGVVRAALAGKE